MDAAPEALTQPERTDAPRKGDVFRVVDSEEIRGAGGLALNKIERKNGVLSPGPKYLEDKIVRMPVGAKVTVIEVFKDSEGVWVVFDYSYMNPLQGQKTLHACALVEKISVFSRTSYMEKVPETASALEQLKMEIEGSR